MVRFIKIRFVEWRDQNTFAALQRAGDDARAAREVVDRARDKAQRLRQKSDERLRVDRVNLSDPNVQRPAYMQEADQAEQELQRLEDRSRPLQDVAALLSEQNAKASRANERCGTFGYQVVDDAGGVVKIVDENGNDLPLGQVYASEVADVNPGRPSWATPQWEAANVTRPTPPVSVPSQ